MRAARYPSPNLYPGLDLYPGLWLPAVGALDRDGGARSALNAAGGAIDPELVAVLSTVDRDAAAAVTTHELVPVGTVTGGLA